jgi:DNA-directed RNA polymerase subunit M/transcription elongation factor TFIIS
MNIIISDCESGNKFRKNIRSKFEIIIGDKKKSVNLEKGIFNYSIREATTRKIIKKWENKHFITIYMSKLWTIFNNIQKNNILEQIKNDELLTQQLAFMTHQEIDPERWHELIERKIKRDESKMNHRVEASTDMFRCKKCKSKRCTYYELQTRSADEPATIFVTCLDCGKNWKS